MSGAVHSDYPISPYGVRCPRCFAAPGQHCMDKGKRLPGFRVHEARDGIAAEQNRRHERILEEDRRTSPAAALRRRT